VDSATNIGRNDPCPCGSGRKYKQCCLTKDEAKAREARAKAAEKEARAAAREAKKAEKEGGSGEGEKAQTAAARASQTKPPGKGQTYQPWKKSSTNTHAFQRMTTPRKVGGS